MKIEHAGFAWGILGGVVGYLIAPRLVSQSILTLLIVAVVALGVIWTVSKVASEFLASYRRAVVPAHRVAIVLAGIVMGWMSLTLFAMFFSAPGEFLFDITVAPLLSSKR